MSHEEQWDTAEPDTRVGRCEWRYGEVRPLKLRTDPFVDEGIFEPDPDRPGGYWFCKPCYDERREDV